VPNVQVVQEVVPNVTLTTIGPPLMRSFTLKCGDVSSFRFRSKTNSLLPPNITPPKEWVQLINKV
jgi:hypothetical protein